MVDYISSGRSAEYRAASEELHRGRPVQNIKRAAHYDMLWACGLADLIKRDFYQLLALSAYARGTLLDAGCGGGADALAFHHAAPGLQVRGVDVSSVSLPPAAAQPDSGRVAFYQSSLEQLPFGDASFDYIASHEVIEHVETPAIVISELARVLKGGGICVIATPNGASLWIEHLRQRAMRLFGRRGAPVGADHTRTPGYWRREFRRAGLFVERQMFDGAALEFQLFVAPAKWMAVLSRALEPLRIVPGLNLCLCDRVKFRLRKPGPVTPPSPEATPCCPICHSALAQGAATAICASNHLFARNALGLIDFSTVVSAPSPAPVAAVSGPLPAHTAPAAQVASPAAAPPVGDLAGSARDTESGRSAPAGRGYMRRLRRGVLLTFSAGYAIAVLMLVPAGLILGWWRQPFDE